jgi:hypothetical protein
MTAEKKSGKETPENTAARDAGYTSEDLMKVATRRLRASKGNPTVPTQSA